MAEEQQEKRERIEPGNYVYTVLDAEPTTFKSGNKGIKLKLEGKTEDGKTFKFFDNLVAVKKAEWKSEEFKISIGFEKDAKVKSDDIRGKRGQAYFEYEAAPDGKEYLRAKKYLPKAEEKESEEEGF